MTKRRFGPRVNDEQYDYLLKKLDEFKEGSNSVGNSSNTSANDYKPKKPFVLSAWNNKGYMMEIDEYCTHYGLKRDDVSSWKLVSHTGTPFYNIVFKERTDESNKVDIEHIRNVINQQTKRTYTYKHNEFKSKAEGVLKWADLHFGAHIENLVLSKDYNQDILLDGLLKSVEDLNQLGFKKAHVHINGDLIESFSGLNHINSWMSMDKELVGAKSVMLCCDLLEKALNKIDNLGSIKIVAGNHDRLSKDNKEDVKGGAAELIAWGLTLKGFDVEFNPYVISHLVDGINHINLHGHCGISKKSTTDIIWKYGIKGMFNFVFEAHLHSQIEKLSAVAKDKFSIIKDDSIDFRRLVLQSFFTGNYYSETLGYLSNAGYLIVWDNGNKKPMTFNGTI